MKFKNIKIAKRKSAPPARKPAKKGAGDSGKPSQFPSIYRRITERFSFRLPWQAKPNNLAFLILASASILISVALLIGIVFFGLKTYQNSTQVIQINNQRQNLQNKISFWQSVNSKFNGYKDAYFQKALLEYQLNDIKQAKLDNQKALQLDPNFTDAKQLEEVLDKGY